MVIKTKTLSIFFTVLSAVLFISNLSYSQRVRMTVDERVKLITDNLH